MAKKSKKKSLKDKMARSVTTEKQKRSSYGYLKLPNGVPVYKAAPGKSNIRFDIMPYLVTDAKHPDRDTDFEIATKGEEWYRRPFRIHRNVGTNNEPVVCPTSFGLKCPICEARIKRISEGADKEERDAMKTFDRCLYVVIPKKSKDFEEKPHIWDFSYHNFEKLFRDEIEEDPDNGCFSDLEGGLTIKVRFSSKTLRGGKPFAQAAKVEFLTRELDYEESIIEEIPNLDEVLTCKSYKEIENLWFELDTEETEEEAKEAPEEEAEEAKEAPEEEAEEAKEKPKRKKKKKKVVEEEEETTDELKARIDKKAEKAKKIVTEKPGKTKCPFGHKFGKDCETSDDCDACDLWEDCSEAQENE